jgi:hypothetical protein
MNGNIGGIWNAIGKVSYGGRRRLIGCFRKMKTWIEAESEFQFSPFVFHFFYFLYFGWEKKREREEKWSGYVIMYVCMYVWVVMNDDGDEWLWEY